MANIHRSLSLVIHRHEGNPSWAEDAPRTFASAVAHSLGATSDVQLSEFSAAPDEGFVLGLAPSSETEFRILRPSRRAALTPRFVPLCVPISGAFELLTEFPLPAVVEAGGFGDWTLGDASGGYSGLVGRVEVACKLGKTKIRFERDGIAMIGIDKVMLPDLLARYLTAWEEYRTFS